MSIEHTHQFVGRYVEEVESWKKDHDEVMEKYRLADELTKVSIMGQAVLERLRMTPQNSFDDAVLFAQSLQLWYVATSFMLMAIDQCESEGYPVGGSKGLRKAHEDLSCVIAETDVFIRQVEDLKDGRYIPADEFINELRSKVA